MLGVLCPLLALLFNPQCPTLLFTLRSPLGAHSGIDKEEPCCAKPLAPVTLQDEILLPLHILHRGKKTPHLTRSKLVS